MPGSPAAQLIVLHAGFHKTGTTHLQKALLAHRADLAPQFGVVTRTTDPLLAAACDAAREFSERAGPVRREALRTRLTAWVEALTLAPGQGLLIAAPDLAGQIPGGKTVKTYAAAPIIARLTVAALTARFGPDLDLRLLYTTRRAEDWLRALHWHLARQPVIEVSAEHFIKTQGEAARFEPLIARLRADLPGLRIDGVALEALTPRRLGPVEALYDLADLPDALRARLRRVPAEDQAPVYDLSGAFIALNKAKIPREALRRLKLALLASAELDRDLGD